MTLPDPAVNPTLQVPEAGALFNLGRAASYEQARRYLETDGAEGLPVLAFGRQLRCPTATVLQMLGVASPDNGLTSPDNLGLTAVNDSGAPKGATVTVNKTTHDATSRKRSDAKRTP